MTATGQDSVGGTMRVIVDPWEWVCGKRQELIPASSLRARFTRGVFWSLTGAVISRGCTLMASIACARLLGKAGFGELGIIQSTVGTFGVFAGLGLGLTATRFVAEFRERDAAKAGRILALSSLAATISGTMMAVILIVVAPHLAANTLAARQLAGPLAVGAGLVFLGALNGAQTGALAGLEAFRTIAKVNMGAGLSSFPLIVVGVCRRGLMGAVWGMLAAMALNWAMNNYALRKECSRLGITYDFAGCLREWRVLYKFSLPAFLASIVVGPALWGCNALLVRQPNGYAQLGLYTAADRWRLLILFVPTSVFSMLVPVLSNLYGGGDLLRFRRVFRRNLFWLSGLALFCAMLVASGAKPIMSFYGASFHSGWPILVILSLSAVPEALNTLLGHPLIVANAMWWRFVFDALLALALVGMAFAFVPRWGAFGLASAYGLAFSAVSIGLYFFGSVRVRKVLSQDVPPSAKEAPVLSAG